MPFITEPVRQEFREFMVSSPLMTDAANFDDIASSGRQKHWWLYTIDPVLQIVISLRVLNSVVGDVAGHGRQHDVVDALDTASGLRSRVSEVVAPSQAKSIERTLDEVIRLCKKGLASPL